jgi:hypothetical protein
MAPAARPKGASVQAVTVVAVGVGQPGAVVVGVVAGKGPSRRLLTVTTVTTSFVRPTAPFHPNSGAAPVGFEVHGDAPLLAPSVAAGSPRCSGVPQLLSLVQPGHMVLKTAGNSLPGRPAAMSSRPESGPKENMKVCVPSASVMNPSPPETCWHLMAPFTVAAVGV